MNVFGFRKLANGKEKSRPHIWLVKADSLEDAWGKLALLLGKSTDEMQVGYYFDCKNPPPAQVQAIPTDEKTFLR